MDFFFFFTCYWELCRSFDNWGASNSETLQRDIMPERQLFAVLLLSHEFRLYSLAPQNRLVAQIKRVKVPLPPQSEPR